MFNSEIENIQNEYKLNDIVILEAKLGLEKSCCVKCGSQCIIGVDTDKVESIAELRSLILHEAGHCREGAFYNCGATKNERRHAEYLAITWAIRNCIPFDQYIDAIRSGVRDVYQLAEYFNVTVESATKASEFYTSRLIDYLKLAQARGHAV
ncbi:MAG: hypothetical protein KBT27_13345 [Prevotellaceae bacterium]|nr:hypothetical protein [Candidatus Faecinaster equi]